MEVVLLSCYRADQAGDGGRWPVVPAPVVFSQSASHSLSQLWHFLGTPQALWLTSLHLQSPFRFIMFTLVALRRDVCFMHALHFKRISCLFVLFFENYQVECNKIMYPSKHFIRYSWDFFIFLFFSSGLNFLFILCV